MDNCAGNIAAIVIGVYAIIISCLFIILLLYVIKLRRAKITTTIPNIQIQPKGLSNPAFPTTESTRRRRDVESAQDRFRRGDSPIGHVKVELRREEAPVESLSSVHDDFRQHRRNDSVDALSFGTVLSTDNDDAPRIQLEKKRTYQNLDERPDDVEFSSVKSDSDSVETLYDDVLTATPRVGVRRPSGQRGRPSLSSTLSNEFFDVVEIDRPAENHYLDLEGDMAERLSTSSSSSDSSTGTVGSVEMYEVTYDDVVSPAHRNEPQPQKKAPPPKPPKAMAPTIPRAEDVSKTDKLSTSSVSSSSESPQLRNKEHLQKDRDEARRSYQAAPEHYRKESSYLDPTTDVIVSSNVPIVEIIREEVTIKLSSSSNSTISSTSSKTTVIDGKKGENEKKVERSNSESSSSSDSTADHEEDQPKFAPRKSSYSSPSEIEIPEVQPEIFTFGRTPGETADDVIDGSNKFRPQFTSNEIRTVSDDDSDSSSTSENSLHLQKESFQKVQQNTKNLVRTDTVTSSDLSEKEVQQQQQQQQQEKKIIKPKQMTRDDSLKSTSSDSSSAESYEESPYANLVGQKRTPLQQKSDSYEVDDFPVKYAAQIPNAKLTHIDQRRGFRIEEEIISESDSESGSESSSSSDDEDQLRYQRMRGKVPSPTSQNVKQMQQCVKVSASSDSSTESEVEVSTPKRLTKQSPVTEMSPDSSDNEINLELQKAPKAKTGSSQEPIRQCVKVEHSSSSESDSSSSSSMSSREDAKTTNNINSIPKSNQIQHANTLPFDKRHAKQNERRGSDAPFNMLGSTLADNNWSPSMLKRLNPDYEPVYDPFRKISSSSQPETVRSNTTYW